VALQQRLADLLVRLPAGADHCRSKRAEEPPPPQVEAPAAHPMQRRASTPKRSGKIPTAMEAHQTAGAGARPKGPVTPAGAPKPGFCGRHATAVSQGGGMSLPPRRSPYRACSCSDVEEPGPLGCGVCSEAAGACPHSSAAAYGSAESMCSCSTVAGKEPHAGSPAGSTRACGSAAAEGRCRREDADAPSAGRRRAG
jgi:hypothetical protein